MNPFSKLFIILVLLSKLFLLPCSTFAAHTLDVFCKCGSVSNIETASITKISFDNGNMIVSGTGQTFSLSTTRKIVFAFTSSVDTGAVGQNVFAGTVYPNPFNPVAFIDLRFPAKGMFSAALYNCLGQQVKTVASQPVAAGQYRFCWNGRNDKNAVVATGVYVLSLNYNGRILNKKLIFAK